MFIFHTNVHHRESGCFCVFFFRKMYLARPSRSLNNVPAVTLTLPGTYLQVFLQSSIKVHGQVLYLITTAENSGMI